jgi:hypothetical protein
MYTDNSFALNQLSLPFAPAEMNRFDYKNNRTIAHLENRPGEGYQINTTDKVFVRVVQYGRVLLDQLFVGVGSMSELMAELKKLLSTTCGLVTVNVRNSSQGWLQKNCVRLNRQRVSFPQMSA